MLMLCVFRALASTADMILWLLNLAAKLLARALNMPEPLVHSTCVFVLTHVQAFETRIGRRLHPARPLRQLRIWHRQMTR